MIHSEYLDLAIGLAVVFFLCSLVVSGLNEGINWLTRVRAKFLWAYLYDLFDPKRGTAGKALPRGFGGIANLWGATNDKRPDAGGAPSMPPGPLASADPWLARLAYALDPIDAPQLRAGGSDRKLTAIKSVPSGSLAQALLEVFAEVGRQEIEATITTLVDPKADQSAVNLAADRIARAIAPDAPNAPAGALVAFRAALDAAGSLPAGQRAPALTTAAQSVANTLLKAPGARETLGFATAWIAMSEAWPTASNAATVTAVTNALVHTFPDGFGRQRIENALDRLGKDSPLYPTMRRLWEAAAGRIDVFRTSIESYLDGELQRLSGYYRRSIRIVVFGLAVLVATVGGIDTFSVTRALWRNPDARAALVQEADKVTTTAGSTTAGSTSPGSTPAALASIQQECAKANPTKDATITNSADAADAYAKVRRCVADALDRLTGLGVIDHAVWIDGHGWAADWSRGFVPHAIGLLLTALALVLGAPFWFDALKRLTGIRKGLSGDT